jgi:hypothetical protein
MLNVFSECIVLISQVVSACSVVRGNSYLNVLWVSETAAEDGTAVDTRVRLYVSDLSLIQSPESGNIFLFEIGQCLITGDLVE